MSISVWDKPAEMNINPIPWEFILKAGMSKDKMYQDEVDKIQPYQDKLLNYKSLPGDDQTYLQGAQNKLRDLVNSTVGMKDLTDPLEAKKFLDQARQIGLDPKLLRNQNVLEHYQKQQEVKKDYMGKPDGTYASQDYAFNKMLNQVVTPGSGGSDKYDLTKYSIGPVGTNLEDERTKYFNQLAPVSTSTPKQLGDWYYNLKTEGISEDRIKGQALMAINNYRSSGAGRQELSDYNMLLETNPQALVTKDKDGLRVKTATEYLYEKLLTTGMERYGISTTADMADALNKGVQDQKDNPYLSGMTTPTQFDPYMKVENVFGIKSDDRLDWTDDGNPIITPKIPASTSPNAGSMGGGIMSGTSINSPNDAAREKLNAQYEKEAKEKQIDIIRKVEIFRAADPNLKDKSRKEIYTLMNQAQTNASASFSAYTYPQMDDGQIAGRILGNLNGRNLHLVSSAGEGGNFDLVGIANKLGTTSNEIQKAIQEKAKAGGAKFVPLNASGKPGYLVQIVNGDKTADIIVPISNEANAVFGKFNYAFDAYKTGKTGINKDAKIFPEDEGVYTGLETHVDPNDPTGKTLVPEWVVGRVQSYKETQDFLKAHGDSTGKPMTKEQARSQGLSFTPDGRLVVKDIPELIHETTNQFMNSPYMKGYLQNQPQHTPTYNQ